MWVNLLGVALVLPRFRHGEQLSGLGEAVGALAVGEHPVVANAVEAFWQDVGEETPDELARRQHHDFEAAGAVDAIVLVFERDGRRVGGDQSAVQPGGEPFASTDVAGLGTFERFREAISSSMR